MAARNFRLEVIFPQRSRQILTAVLAAFAIIVCIRTPQAAMAQSATDIPPKERCPVCGMFVAKYPVWVTQLRLRDGKVLFFDGVKDLLVFYRSPEKYSAQGKDISEVWVKDYYTLEWLDGRKAFYVIGSDVYGPMGHEFIPFAGAEGAENFKRDHKGTQVLPFDGITPPLLEKMRQGQNMRP